MHTTQLFEIVDIATHGDETYYKVKPVEAVYGVPAELVEEERHSEKKPVEGNADRRCRGAQVG